MPGKTTLKIGHINLAASINGIGEHFVRLIEALARQGVEQHVIVANASLARRILLYDDVTVGPVARTAVGATCLMPDVALAHVHEPRAARAGLLLTLTRSIPYVLTRREVKCVGRSPIARSTISRAAGVICPNDDSAGAVLGDDFTTPVDVVADIAHASLEADASDNRVASEHVRIYRRATDSRGVPALLL